MSPADTQLVRSTTSAITPANRWDHLLARCGVNRSGHRVEPGLYALGDPTPDSPVFVTANYTLSFDALRSALAGIDGYILVLDTQGINVWCAAGKGTFGTDELVHRIEATALARGRPPPRADPAAAGRAGRGRARGQEALRLQGRVRPGAGG